MKLRTNLEHSSKSQNETAGSTNKEHGSHVQSKRNERVREHDEKADVDHLPERSEAFGKGQEAGIDDGTHRRVIVERAKGIHLKSVMAEHGTVYLEPLQENLDHHQPARLELAC